MDFQPKQLLYSAFVCCHRWKNKTKTNDECTSLWKAFNNKRKKWSLDYTEKSVSRVEGSLAYSSYPGPDNFSYISLQKRVNKFWWHSVGFPSSPGQRFSPSRINAAKARLSEYAPALLARAKRSPFSLTLQPVTKMLRHSHEITTFHASNRC